MATLFEAPLAAGSPEHPEAHEMHEFEYEHPEAHEFEYEHPEAHEFEMHEFAQEHPEAHEFGAHEFEYEHPEAHEYEAHEMHEFEYEHPESHEYEAHEFEYEHPEAHEYEAHEFEYEHPEAHEFEMHEFEYEHPEAHEYEAHEFEYEADAFVGRALRRFKRAALRRLGTLAKGIAPVIAGKLTSFIPGVGLLAAPLAARLTAQLVREGELEAQEAEAHLFGTNEAHPEVGAHESSHEAALTEMLAAEAAASPSHAEAVSVLSASLPLTITIMGGRRRFRRVVPALTQANTAMVRSILQQGPGARQLLRTVPTIQRQTITTLRAAARRGQPVTGPMAVNAMAASARRVLGNQRRVEAILQRNLLLRQQVAPPRGAFPGRMASTNGGRAYGSRPMAYRRYAG